MPVYTVQGPSGAKYRIEGPEGATADELGQVILSNSRDERIALQRSQDAQTYAPTVGMNAMERGIAAAGKGLTDIARGAGQWLGPGVVSRADVAESRRLDAPLMDTTAGKVGNFVGKAVPLAAASVLVPGAGTMAGATGIGAVSGAVEPSESTGETVRNIGTGAVFGAAGQKLGNVIADKLAQRAADKASQFASSQAANAQKLEAAKDASQAGYVIPPSDIQPQGAITEAIAGLSGKIKTAQVASARNQAVTDALARKAVGLQPQDALTNDVLSNIRKQAGAAYDQFRNAGQVQADQAYNTALDNVAKQLQGATRSFPGLKSDKVTELVDTMRQPSFDAGDAIDATKVLRELAEGAYSSGDKQLGKAYRSVSDALEESLDRHLATTAPDAVKQFREARQLIAKTYTVQKALNSETGNVSAPSLAADLKKNKPLSNELLQIAQTAQAFPKATQALKEAPKDLSPLDYAAALGGLTASGGNPLAALGLLLRPGARSLVLSGPVQRNAMRDISAPTGRMAQIADNELSRLLYGPLGAVAAVNSGQ